MNKKHISWIVAAGVGASFAIVLAIALPASAQTISGAVGAQGGGWGGHVGIGVGVGMRSGRNMPPGVFGTVSSVNGTTLTVTSRMRPNATSTTATVYTVDASGATVYKDGATSTIASVATGDMVMVQGTVSGTNVTATVIRDGFGGMMGGRPGMPGGFGHGSTSTSPRTPPTLPIQGNGEPVVAGSITAISGTTVTVTNASNITYTIDASSAKIIKNGTTTALSDLMTGDNVVVQGAVSGTSISAYSIIDQGSAGHGTGGGAGGSVSGSAHAGVGVGFFGAIGNFFKRLFGF